MQYFYLASVNKKRCVLKACFFLKHLTEISNDFISAKTIRKRLKSILDLDVEQFNVHRKRKSILNFNYRRSKCKYNEVYRHGRYQTVGTIVDKKRSRNSFKHDKKPCKLIKFSSTSNKYFKVYIKL